MVFGEFFRLPTPFKNISEMEVELQSEKTTFMIGLTDFIIAMLNVLPVRPRPTLLSWEDIVKRRFFKHLEDQDEFSVSKLNVEERVHLLYLLCEDVLEYKNIKFNEFCSNVDSDSIRYQPVGYDDQGKAYWYFGDDKLYREEWCATSYNGDPVDAPWVLLCANLQDWKRYSEALEEYLEVNKPRDKKRGPAAYIALKNLFHDLSPIFESVIERLETLEKKRARQEYFDSIPKRTSDRILVKQLKHQEDERVMEIRRRERELGEMKLKEQEKRLAEERRLQEEEERRVQEEEARIKRQEEREMRRLLGLAERNLVRAMNIFKSDKDSELTSDANKRKNAKESLSQQISEKKEELHTAENSVLKDQISKDILDLELKLKQEYESEKNFWEDPEMKRVGVLIGKDITNRILDTSGAPESVKKPILEHIEYRNTVCGPKKWRRDLRLKHIEWKVDLKLIEVKSDDRMRHQCYRILEELKKSKNALAFLEPVDPVALKIPHYFDIIEKPMDLSTMSKKVLFDEYENLNEFYEDFNQICQNCYLFNAPQLHIVTECKSMERDFVAYFTDFMYPLVDFDFFDEYPLTQAYLDDIKREKEEEKKQRRRLQRQEKKRRQMEEEARLKAEKEEEKRLKLERETHVEVGDGNQPQQIPANVGMIPKPENSSIPGRNNFIPQNQPAVPSQSRVPSSLPPLPNNHAYSQFKIPVPFNYQNQMPAQMQSFANKPVATWAAAYARPMMNASAMMSQQSPPKRPFNQQAQPNPSNINYTVPITNGSHSTQPSNSIASGYNQTKLPSIGQQATQNPLNKSNLEQPEKSSHVETTGKDETVSNHE